MNRQRKQSRDSRKGPLEILLETGSARAKQSRDSRKAKAGFPARCYDAILRSNQEIVERLRLANSPLSTSASEAIKR